MRSLLPEVPFVWIGSYIGFIVQLALVIVYFGDLSMVTYLQHWLDWISNLYSHSQKIMYNYCPAGGHGFLKISTNNSVATYLLPSYISVVWIPRWEMPVWDYWRIWDFDRHCQIAIQIGLSPAEPQVPVCSDPHQHQVYLICPHTWGGRRSCLFPLSNENLLWDLQMKAVAFG